MADRTLEVRLRNEDDTLRPETLRIRDLAEIASYVEDAVAAATGIRLEHGEDTPVLVSLTGIEGGSARLLLTLATSALAATVGIKQALISRDYSRLPMRCQKKLSEMSGYLSARGWQAELAGVSPGRALISAAHPVPAPERRTIKSVTTIYGDCVRVGGETPKAGIWLVTTKRILNIDVDPDLARVLGNHLYDCVGITGTATLDAATLDMLAFRGEALLPYRGKAADPLAAVLRIAEGSVGVWEGIDPLEYVRQLREDEEAS